MRRSRLFDTVAAMKLTRLALTTLVIGCSGPAKQPAQPQPETAAIEAGGPAATGDGSATGDAAKPEKAPSPPDTGGYHLIAPSEVKYAPLDPKGPGPEIAVLHGDPQKGGAFFLRFPAGAKPGLHTHTSDYHAVVVSGAPRHWLAGGEAKAKPQAPGSYWFQPGNQAHGDECTGKEPCVMFVIMSGAFDMALTPKAKPGPAGKYTLTSRKDAKFAPMDPSNAQGPKVAFLSGDPKTGPVGFIIEIPAGGKAPIHSHTSDYHALVLDGAPAHWLPHQLDQGEALAPGSYWFQPGGFDHGDRCTSSEPCHGFVFMDKAMDFKPAAKQ